MHACCQVNTRHGVRCNHSVGGCGITRVEIGTDTTYMTRALFCLLQGLLPLLVCAERLTVHFRYNITWTDESHTPHTYLEVHQDWVLADGL
jgi:hypothetical protein